MHNPLPGRCLGEERGPETRRRFAMRRSHFPCQVLLLATAPRAKWLFKCFAKGKTALEGKLLGKSASKGKR